MQRDNLLLNVYVYVYVNVYVYVYVAELPAVCVCKVVRELASSHSVGGLKVCKHIHKQSETAVTTDKHTHVNTDGTYPSLSEHISSQG